MRKMTWSLFGLILIACLWLWFGHGEAQEGERVRVRVWKGWSGSAKHDNMALAKAFLAKRGIVLTVEQMGILPQAMERNDETLLLDADVDGGTETEKAQLRAWVESGGRLIILANRDWAAYFNIDLEAEGLVYPHQFKNNTLIWREKGEAVLTVEPAAIITALKSKKYSKKTAVIAGVYSNAYPQSAFGRKIALGKGELVVLGHSTGLWHNHSHQYKGKWLDEDEEYVPLAYADNAAYLHALLQGRSKARLLYAKQEASSKKPFDYIWDIPELKWWATLTTALLGLLALLWRGGRRFGALIMPQASAGHDMQQHLLAAGYFWARQKDYGYAYLAGQMRQRLLTEMPMLQNADAAPDAEILAASGLSAAQFRRLVQAALPQTEADFIDFVRAAEQLRAAVRRKHE